MSEPVLTPPGLQRPPVHDRAASEMAVPRIIVDYSDSTLLDTAADATANLSLTVPPPPAPRPALNADAQEPAAAAATPGQLKLPGPANLRPTRPVLQRFYSLPSAPTLSPARHHFRLQSAEPRMVKETPSLAFSEDSRGRFVNQYLVRRVVGHGSYGLVYEAVDVETNTAFAIKEYSKTRLLKLNRKVMMQMRRQGHSAAAMWTPATAGGLIRGEVAIMKRIDHPNLVALHEVIDDQRSDKLFMVIEWCDKGTIMPPECNYDGKATPLDEERCRLYFRDMILGVEYLHAQGIAHRDIKADNVLLSDDDVLKIADFGVSEMFDRASENDTVQGCVGSPAYMSPELALISGGGAKQPVVLPKKISGRKADIWAMGVTLFYMSHGRLPFEANCLDELYCKILNEEPEIGTGCSPELKDLFKRILCKDANTRISLNELREHPWVTSGGHDELLPYEENVEGSTDVITEEDLSSAVESLQQRFSQQSLDWYNLAKRLQAGHGFRAPSLGNRTPNMEASRTPSFSSGGGTPPDSDFKPSFKPGHRSGESLGKMEKLTMALDEIIRSNQLDWEQTSDLGNNDL